jgi:FMN phosphatase YigB (HAD superfamily)
VTIISGDIGIAKPDVRIFNLALEQLGVKPN